MKKISKINENIIPVKVGVIGIGNMGWHHARVLSLLKDAELIGVADLDEERGKLAMEQFNCNWYGNYKDLLHQVEAVCIAVPTLFHHEVGLECLKSGKHVLIEKPIVSNTKEYRKLLSIAKKNKLILIKVLLTYRLLKFHQLLTYCLLQHMSLKLAQCQMGESLAKYFHQNNICNHQFFLVL